MDSLARGMASNTKDSNLMPLGSVGMMLAPESSMWEIFLVARCHGREKP